MSRLFLALLFFSGIATSAWAEDKPASIKLCYENEEIYPWRLKDGVGLNFTLLKMVGEKLGVRLDFVAAPWRRCLADMQSGDVDGAFAASFTEERLAMGAYPSGADGKPDPSRQLMIDGYHLFKLKGATLGWDGKQFTNLTGVIATGPGYSVIALLKAAGATVDEGARGTDNILQKVALGRAQGAALITIDGEHALKTIPELGNALEEVPLPLVEKPYYVMLSHQLADAKPGFARSFWDTVASVRESAEYKKAQVEFLAR
jgi:polar amino acid transport system substrate-binding protein